MLVKFKVFLIAFFSILIITGIIQKISGQTQKENFQPDFASLEKSNPVPEWFKDAKFGIYFHWGVYSVPAFSNEWYPHSIYIKGSLENKHHVQVYGDVSQWPYHNFITGAEERHGNFVQFAPKLKSEGGKFDPKFQARFGRIES